MDINEILGLIGGERHGDDGRYNTASTVLSACHNYSLAGTSQCLPDVTDATWYIEIPAFEPIEYVKQQRSIELGNGDEAPVWTRTEPRVRFVIHGNQDLLNAFNRLALHETLTFTNLTDSVTAVVRPGTMQIQSSPQDDHYRIEVSLLFADAAIVTSLCCGSYYENAPFDDCDGGGAGSGNPECAAFTVSIGYSAGPPPELTATPLNEPDPTVAYVWYLDNVYFGAGATIQPVLPGVYRVVATSGTCSTEASYTYSGDCAGYEVTIQDITTEDGGHILIALANLVSTFQWQVFNDPTWDDIPGETGMVYEPDADGDYRVVAQTTGGCEATSDPVTVDLPIVCTDLFTLDIVNSGGSLVVTINDYAGVGTPAYEWWQDTGNGLQLTGFTGASVNGATPGYWVVTVTIDGCSVSTAILVQCTPTGVPSDCSQELYQEFAGTGVNNEFAITNFSLPDPAFFTEVQIESMLVIDRQGLKMRFTSGTPSTVFEYTIDYAAQEIHIASDFPLEIGDSLGVLKVNSR